MSSLVNIKVKRVGEVEVPIPSKASLGAAGFDVHAALSESLTLEPMQRALIPTGMQFEIPIGYEVQVRSRSGLAYKEGLFVLNSPGTIDSDFRGEVKVLLMNLGIQPMVIKPLDRVAQLVVAPVLNAQFTESDQLTDTSRGAGGFGSTGVSS